VNVGEEKKLYMQLMNCVDTGIVQWSMQSVNVTTGICTECILRNRIVCCDVMMDIG